ncbi:MAG: hypothetical protein KTR35_09990 [Gammaproteobacteria bacterium]|nr:hypothetical protein [Gammaproteobacteria bacterium]
MTFGQLNQHKLNPFGSLFLLFVLFLAVGWFSGFLWAHWGRINELFYAASEQKYLTMTGDVGPATYLIYHENYSSLEEFADRREDVLGVEFYRFPNVAAMAFKEHDSESIELVTQLETVQRIQYKQVPMICH